MDIISKACNLMDTLGEALVHHVWAPLLEVALAPDKGTWFQKRIPRNSDGVSGLELRIPFLTELPWAWRGMREEGYTPTGSKFASGSMTAELTCHAYSMMVGLFELEKSGADQSAIKDIMNRHGQWMVRTYPYYLRAILWTSNGAQKAMGKVVSVNGLEVTLDNAGLWNTGLKDRAKLFEPGMILQAYRSTAKLGSPVKVTAVNKGTGVITLDEDPGLADNDTFVCADIGGLDIPYADGCPGILDVLDDDNTFQGVNRSTAANAWARAVVKSGSGVTFGRAMFQQFFQDCYFPNEAVTHPDVINAYWENVLADNIRYANTRSFEDGVVGLKIDNTTLVGDWDCDRDKVLVPAFGESGIRLADKGEIAPLFNQGWKQLEKRPFLEKTYCKWLLLVAEDCRKAGLLHTITLPS